MVKESGGLEKFIRGRKEMGKAIRNPRKDFDVTRAYLIKFPGLG